MDLKRGIFSQRCTNIFACVMLCVVLIMLVQVAMAPYHPTKNLRIIY